MSYLAESKFFSHYLCPLFNCTAFNFNGVTTALTYQVMMVGIAAQAIDSFSIFSAQEIHNLVINS